MGRSEGRKESVEFNKRSVPFDAGRGRLPVQGGGGGEGDHAKATLAEEETTRRWVGGGAEGKQGDQVRQPSNHQ
jgi:hypothetical protein